LQQFKAETGLDVKVHTCLMREPTAPSDFEHSIVEQLLNRDVVLEVWGRAVSLSDENGPYNQAEIGYLIVPVRFFEFNSAEPPGAFIITNRTEPIQSVDDLMRLLNQAGRLGAYASLASGSVLMRSTLLGSKRWDRARGLLCRAALTLRVIAPGGATADAELATYAEKLAADVLDGARADAGYSGSLKVMEVGAACSG
jgi:hypothetical protein